MALRQSFVHEAKGFVGALQVASEQLAPGSVSEPVRERRGYLYALGAALRNTSELRAPPSSEHERVHPAVAALAPQHSSTDADDPFWQWMTLAALAEHDGDYGLARTMVSEVLARVVDNADNHVRHEQMAVCWARRGRLARQVGELADAEECFSEAQRLVRGTVSRDAWPQSQLGLAVLAGIKGNFPLTLQRARSVVNKRPVVPIMYRISAYQVLSNEFRRRAQFVDALLSGWQAYDLLDRDDTRRFEVLNTLASIALEAGELDAAEAGFTSLLRNDLPERITMPTCVGLFQVWQKRFVQARDRSALTAAQLGLRSALQSLLANYAQAVQPYGKATLLLSITEAYSSLGEFTEATSYLDRATTLCEERGYNALSFQADTLRATIDRESRKSPTAHDREISEHHVPTATESRSARSRAHPAVTRLIQLATP